MPILEKQRDAVAWSAPCLAKDTKHYRMVYQRQERRTISSIPASPLYLPSCNSYFLKGAATVMVLYSAYLVLFSKSARSNLRVYSFCWVIRCRRWFPSLQIKNAHRLHLQGQNLIRSLRKCWHFGANWKILFVNYIIMFNIFSFWFGWFGLGGLQLVLHGFFFKATVHLAVYRKAVLYG